MKNKLFQIVIILLSFTACKKEKIIQNYTNINQPLYLPDANGDSASVADPHVIKVGNTWYLYGTNTTYNIEVWYSDNLENWKYGGVVFQPTVGAWNEKGLWAPSVHHGSDGFYMYYTARENIGVAYATTPLGPFEDVYNHPFIGGGYGKIGDGYYFDGLLSFLNSDELAIDAFLFKDNDGKLYMYFSAVSPFQVIKVIPMADYKTLKDVAPVTVLEPDILSWEKFTREAPWVMNKNGKYYLMYSGDTYLSDDYGVGVATSTLPTKQFMRVAGNPILKKDASRKLYGAGHNAVTEGKNNDLLMFYHTRKAPGGNTPRVTEFTKMYFDSNGNIQLQWE